MKVIHYTLIDAIAGRSEDMYMNKAQRETIKAIADRIPKFDFYGGPEKYEIKCFDINQFVPEDEIEHHIFSNKTRPVYISFTTGMIGDEGTLAGIYCRKTRHFEIGPRGGIRSGIWRGKVLPGFQSCSLFDLLNWHYTN